MAPKVSICIPVYKQAELFKMTFESVLEQTYKDWEIIVADDSPDDTIEKIVAAYSSIPVAYFRNEPALGSPANWNAAVSKAKGEYIKILHHDDRFAERSSLERFVKMLDDHKDADLAFSSTQITMLDTGLSKKHKCSVSKLRKIQKRTQLLLMDNIIGAPSATIIRKNAFVKFDETLKWLVDIDWYLSVMKKNNHVIYESDCLIASYHGAVGQMTSIVQSDKEIQIKEHIMMLERYQDILNDKELFLLYQLLFHKYNINSIEDVKKIYSFNNSVDEYIRLVITEKNKNTLLKKIRYWSGKMSLKDYVYLIRKKLK